MCNQDVVNGATNFTGNSVACVVSVNTIISPGTPFFWRVSQRTAADAATILVRLAVVAGTQPPSTSKKISSKRNGWPVVMVLEYLPGSTRK